MNEFFVCVSLEKIEQWMDKETELIFDFSEGHFASLTKYFLCPVLHSQI